MSVQLLVQTIDEDRDPIESKSLAFVVKVKVRVVYPGVGHRVQRALVRLLDRLLVARLVDEVDEVLVSVQGHLLIKVTGKRLGGRGEVHDLQVGLVAEVVHFGPVDRDTSSRLDVGELDVALDGSTSYSIRQLQRGSLGRGLQLTLSSSPDTIQETDLFSLVKVGHVALLVNSSRKVTRSSAESTPAGDETEEDVSTVDRGRLDIED